MLCSIEVLKASPSPARALSQASRGSLMDSAIPFARATAIASAIAASAALLERWQAVQAAIGQPRDCGQRAAGDVDQQLVPHRAHDVRADLGGQPGRVHRRRDALHALRAAAVELADHGLLAGDAAAHVAGSEEHAADIGLAGQHALAPDNVGDDVLVAEPVLQRHHDRVGTDHRRPRPRTACRVWKDFTSTMTRSAGPIPSAVVAAPTLTVRSSRLPASAARTG